jgi:hypothetical protein
MNYATQADKDTKQFEVIQASGITVLLDKKAVFFVVGTVMDYEVSHRTLITPANSRLLLCRKTTYRPSSPSTILT